MPTPELPAPRRTRRRAGETISLPPTTVTDDETGEAAGAAAGPAPEPPDDPDADVSRPEEADAFAPVVPEVRRRRRPREQIGFGNRPRPARRWRVSPALLAVALLASAGGGAGLLALLGWSRPRATGPGVAPSTVAAPVDPASETAEPTAADFPEAVEAAYAALEEGRPIEARDRFLALTARADIASRSVAALRAAAAWCELAAGRADAAEGLLVAGLGRAGGGDNADARFLLGLSRLLRGEHAEAAKSFARAAALDPTRADVHVLWGDTLRREGRPRESLTHYRGAIRRNRLETNTGYYRFKLWAAQLQAGGEPAAEATAAIAAALRASDAPGGTVLLGAAATQVAAGRWPEAAELLRRARRATEPLVFAVSLQDPLFTEHAGREELREFSPAASGSPR